VASWRGAVAHVHHAAHVEFEGREKVDIGLTETAKSAASFSLQQKLVVQNQPLKDVRDGGGDAGYVSVLQQPVRMLAPARKAIIQISTKKKRDVVVIAAFEEVIDHLLKICVPEGRVTFRTNGRCG
jgi:hypothetical protein